MKTAAERFQTDPHFQALTQLLYDLYERQCNSGAGFTPSEVREASGLAWQLYVERHALPVVPPTYGGRP